jgi:hypothetical protein
MAGFRTPGDRLQATGYSKSLLQWRADLRRQLNGCNLMGTVLVIEDDPDLRDMLAALLHDEGHVVATAANGRDALESCSI